MVRIDGADNAVELWRVRECLRRLDAAALPGESYADLLVLLQFFGMKGTDAKVNAALAALEDEMIRDYEASGEFKLEQPKDA